MGPWIIAVWAFSGAAPQPEVSLTLVGNAGVLLSDGETSLLVDLPYVSGAFGYMAYDGEALRPRGTTLSVITHHHRDHFDPNLFMQRDDWLVVGPPSVTEGLPSSRVVRGDSVQVGAFAVVSIPTPHTPDHRSYRIRWRGRVFLFAGDTELPGPLEHSPPVDVFFLPPWLSCAEAGGRLPSAARRIAYHLSPAGDDRVCGDVEALPQGTVLSMAAASPEGSRP